MTKCVNCGSEGASYVRVDDSFCDKACYDEHLCDLAEENCNSDCDHCETDLEYYPHYDGVSVEDWEKRELKA